jgi:hypothetical protein
MGQWLVATTRDRPVPEDRQYDEDDGFAVAVHDMAFVLAVRRVLASGQDAAVIADLVRHVRTRYPKLEIATEDGQALVRRALGEDVSVDHIDLQTAFNLRNLVFTELVRTLRLSDADLEDLVAQAEDMVRDVTLETGEAREHGQQTWLGPDRRSAAGGETRLRCWLSGTAAPYPAAPHRGVLVAPPGESVRFFSGSAPVRELVLPAGGLTASTVRDLGELDRLVTALPPWGRRFAVVSCVDSVGTRVRVIVPDGRAKSAAALLGGTAGAAGPERPEAKRSNGWLRRLIGPWTALVFCAAAVAMVLQVVSWRDATAVAGTVVSVGARASGGLACVVEWSDPWTGASRTDEIACPARSAAGQSISAVARPKRALAANDGADVAWIFLILAGLLASPDLSYRVRLLLMEREARLLARPRSAASS